MEFKVGDKIRHYKGGIYEVMGFATHTETGEKLIIYGDDKNVWARPIKMLGDLIQVSRFEVLRD